VKDLQIKTIEDVRRDFPVLQTKVYGKPLIYLDNGATTQKPKLVIDAIAKYYSEQNANIHRGVHYLSQEATALYELTREKVKAFINAEHLHEVIFTTGTTGGINLVASSFGRAFISEGDEVIISAMEHHSNIVPWQMMCEERKAKLKIIPMNEHGDLVIEDLGKLITSRTKIIAVAHVSNALGTVNPVEEIIRIAHEHNVAVLIDGAQAVQHKQIDVQALDCDFYVFSSHKMYGPTGVGILYGKEKWLDLMPPYQGGGDMIKTVTLEKTEYNSLPFKFEAGTPNIADGIALASAIDYLNDLGWEWIHDQEKKVFTYAAQQLAAFPKLRIYCNSVNKAGAISFNIGDYHPYDVGTILDQQGIAVRTGHHCAQPVMSYFKIPGTIRASFALYNTTEEIDKLMEGLHKAVRMLK
jgi:cysteine desulfurase / selenocysteine lyase